MRERPTIIDLRGDPREMRRPSDDLKPLPRRRRSDGILFFETLRMHAGGGRRLSELAKDFDLDDAEALPRSHPS